MIVFTKEVDIKGLGWRGGCVLRVRYRISNVKTTLHWEYEVGGYEESIEDYDSRIQVWSERRKQYVAPSEKLRKWLDDWGNVDIEEDIWEHFRYRSESARQEYAEYLYELKRDMV